MPYHSISYRNKLAGDIAERKGNIQQTSEKLDRMKRDMESMRAFKPEATKVPNISNIVSPTGQLGSVYTIGNMSFTDCYVDNDGWTYRIQKQVINGREVTSIMRAKLNPYDCAAGGCELEFSVEPNPQVVKQWFKFTHEATVMHADAKWTITFNTSTKFDNEKVKAMGANKNSTQKLLNDPGLMVGYAPAAAPTADVSPYLSDYMDRMDEQARHAYDNKKK